MTNMSIKYSKKMYYLWSTRKLEQSQSFRTGYYKAGQTQTESVVLENFTKMARLDVRYTYRKTAVCLPLLRWA